MIVRILGEGQYRIPDDQIATVQEVDKGLEAAVDANDEAAFSTALGKLVATIRELGKRSRTRSSFPATPWYPTRRPRLRKRGRCCRTRD